MNNALNDLIIYRNQCEVDQDWEAVDLLDRVIREMKRLLELERQVEAGR